MRVKPLKLSDFNSVDDFIQKLMDESTNPGQMNYYKKDGDYERIKKAMDMAKELTKLANESNISLWICAHNGIPQVAVSMGAYIASMAMIFKDGDWEQMPKEWIRGEEQCE